MKSGRAESSWNDIQCTYCGTGETAKLCISCCRFCCWLQGAAALGIFTATESSVALCSGNSDLLPMDPPSLATICGISCYLPALDIAVLWIVTANCVFWTSQLVWLKPALESPQLHTLPCAWWETPAAGSSDPDKDGIYREKSKLSRIQRDAQRLFLEC